MCHVHLKALDSTTFFSNLCHERQGPGGELHIRVNMGVDWYVLLSPCVVLTYFRYRFSYICSNIALSHLLCLTSFSICNLPPEYQWVSFTWWLILPFHYLDIACQIFYAQVEYWVRKNRIQTRSSGSYVLSYPTYFASGRTASKFQWNQDQKVRCTCPCGKGHADWPRMTHVHCPGCHSVQ